MKYDFRKCFVALIFLLAPLAVYSQNINIPDPNFKAFLVSNYDTNGDGEIQVSEAEAVTGTMDTPGTSASPGNIMDFTGVEYFTGITKLDCSDEKLTSLNVSSNKNLTYLNCGDNDIASLDLGTNTNLTYLDCYYNQIIFLDVNSITKLTHLNCSTNQITSLDVHENADLQRLDCSRNYISTLDVSANSDLQTLLCDYNQLTTLDVGANSNLQTLNCSHNDLTILNVANCINLQALSCYSNQLTVIDVSTNIELTQFYCNLNQLTNLNVSANTSLRDLRCSYNELNALDLKSNVNLRWLTCDSNHLTRLDVSQCKKLYWIFCQYNQLTDIPNVIGCTDLTEYYCKGNYFNADDCPTITAIKAMGLYTFNYNPQADGYVLDCSSTTSTHTIACSAGVGGTTDPTGMQEVYEGSSQIVHITADSGFHVVDVLVDGTSVGAISSYTFTNVTSDHTISATFSTANSPVIDSFTADTDYGNSVLTVNLNCTAHDPDDGSIVQYLWKITGQRSDTVVTTTNLLTYRFILPGEYSVSVTVTDDEGQTATADLEGNGSNSPITVSGFASSSIPIPSTIQLNPLQKENSGTVETTAVNEFDETATVTLKAKDQSGNELGSSIVTIPANGSAILSVNSFTGLNYDTVESIADRHLVLFSRTSTATAKMTAELSDKLSSFLLVPHIAEEVNYWNTYAYLSDINPSNLEIMVAGQETESTALEAQLINLENYLPTDVTVPNAWGSVAPPTSPFGRSYILTGFEMFIKNGSDGAATELVSESSTTLYIPHIPEETDIFWTGFALLNPGDNPATVTATFYDDDGTVVGTETLSIPANSKIKGLMADLFPSEAGTAKWGKFQSDQPINGIEIYGTYNAGICGFTLPIVANSWGILPDVLTGEGNWTGIAITNVTGTEASVTIQLVGADGTVKEEKTESIAAMHRFKAVVADYFTTATVAPGDTVRYFSDEPIIAVEASGDLDRSFMTALTGSR